MRTQSIRKMIYGTFCACMLITSAFFCSYSNAAEYKGQDIDGISFDATVFCYETGHYYTVTVEFDNDEAKIFFPKGGYITVTLDDEDIDNAHNISAFDYRRATYWDLDIETLD